MLQFQLRPARGPQAWTHEVEKMLENFHTDYHHAASEIVESPAAFIIALDVPGFKKEDIQIEVKDRQLVITGERKAPERGEHDKTLRQERRFGKFSRTFSLPEGIAEEKAEAKFTDGVLEVFLPRTTVEVRRIPVN